MQIISNRIFAPIYITIVVILGLLCCLYKEFVSLFILSQSSSVLPVELFNVGYVGAIIFALSYVTRWRASLIIAFILLIFAYAFAINIKATAIGTAILTVVVLMGFSGTYMYSKFFYHRLSWWIGFSLNLFVLFNIVLILALSGLFSTIPVAMIVLLNCTIGIYEFVKHPNIYLKSFSFLKNCSRTIIAFSIISTTLLFFSFMGSCLPEVHFDSQRYYIQFMERLSLTGLLEANHYSFMELAYWPIQTLGAVGYLFVGEVGGKIISGWIFYVLSFVAIIKILLDENVQTEMAILAGITIIASPIFFYYSQAAYVDLAYGFILLSAIYCVHQTLTKSPHYIPAVFILVGFSFLVKPFSAFYFVVILLFISFFWRKRMMDLLRSHRSFFVWGIGLMLLLMLPRVITTAAWTGNPIFPLLAHRFDKRFVGLSATFLPGVNYYHLPHTYYIDLFVFPYLSVFQTGNKISDSVHEHLNLFFTLASIFLVMLSLTLKRYIAKDIYFYLFSAFGGILLISVLHAPYMRYWFPSIFMLFIALFKWGDQAVLSQLQGRQKKIVTYSLYLFFFIAMGLTFKVYLKDIVHGDQWLPAANFRGDVPLSSYKNTYSANLAHFFDTANTEQTAIAATGFYSNNFIRGHVYDSVPWWDTYNKMSSYEEVKYFVNDKKIKYWVMTKDNHWYDVYEKRFPKEFFDKTTWAYETDFHFVVDMSKLVWK